MNEAAKLVLEVAVGGGAMAVFVRQVVKQAVDHFIQVQTLKVSEELKRVSTAQETQLQLWSDRQVELFKHLLEAKALVIHQLVKNASRLRRAIHGIGDERDSGLISELYRDYWESFYADPILPEKLFDAAHMFRHVAERTIGACTIGGASDRLDENLVRELDDTYATLLHEARSILLPAAEA
jgi:hypothetical protein